MPKEKKEEDVQKIVEAQVRARKNGVNPVKEDETEKKKQADEDKETVEGYNRMLGIATENED